MITYDIDFVPGDVAAAASMKAVHPIWMDVQNGSSTRCSTCSRAAAPTGTFTYPDDAPIRTRAAGEEHVDGADRRRAGGDRRAPAPRRPLRRLSVDARRPRPRTASFTSKAQVLRARGRGVVGRVDDRDPRRLGGGGEGGRHARASTTTYDTTRASWYESMGIVRRVDVPTVPAAPTRSPTPVDQPGVLTHGHLPENDNHGGRPRRRSPTRAKLPPGPLDHRRSTIADFVYGARRPRRAGGTVADGHRGAVDHVRQPRRRRPRASGTRSPRARRRAPSTGIAYPLADADVQFDSGQLGDAGARRRRAHDWTTPADLRRHLHLLLPHPPVHARRVPGGAAPSG